MWSGHAFPPQVAAYAAQKEEARSSERTRPALGRPSAAAAGRKERRRGTAASMKQSLFFILHICT